MTRREEEGQEMFLRMFRKGQESAMFERQEEVSLYMSAPCHVIFIFLDRYENKLRVDASHWACSALLIWNVVGLFNCTQYCRSIAGHKNQWGVCDELKPQVMREIFRTSHGFPGLVSTCSCGITPYSSRARACVSQLYTGAIRHTACWCFGFECFGIKGDIPYIISHCPYLSGVLIDDQFQNGSYWSTKVNHCLACLFIW